MNIVIVEDADRMQRQIMEVLCVTELANRGMAALESDAIDVWRLVKTWF